MSAEVGDKLDDAVAAGCKGRDGVRQWRSSFPPIYNTGGNPDANHSMVRASNLAQAENHSHVVHPLENLKLCLDKPVERCSIANILRIMYYFIFDMLYHLDRKCSTAWRKGKMCSEESMFAHGDMWCSAGGASRWLRRLGIGLATLLLAAAAPAQAPLSIPVKADGSFELPPGAEFVELIHGLAGRQGHEGQVAVPGSYLGDGGPAADARLSPPSYTAVDAAGNVYVSDRENYRVRRVDAETGVISTLAGTGERGYAGDGGPAAAAQLNLPAGLAVDASGNVFVADSYNHRVRRIDAGTGVISTLAGTGERGSGGDGGPAAAARLNLPAGLAVDASGNVFVADTGGGRVRRIDAGTGVISTLAATGGSIYVRSPAGLAVDASGNVYVADSDEGEVLRFDPPRPLRSRRSRAVARRIQVTAGLQPKPGSLPRPGWRWTRRATCTSPTSRG